MGMRRALSPVPVVALALVVALLACCSRGSAAPSPQPGVLSGRVLGHSSQGGDRTPLAGVRVAVYRQRVFVGGPVQEHAPKPVATARTDGAGVFHVRGLPAGRWFVLAVSEAGSGSWVRFDPASGAVITLVVCTDCPVPLIG